MTIKFIGHATFLITTSSGLRLIMDPYESGAFGDAINYAPIRDAADVVTVSHEHADHNFVNGVPGNPVVLRGPKTLEGAQIEVVNAHHDTSGGRERGEDRLFKITADGVSLVHLGDIGHVLTAEQVAALGKVDVLLIPVGGTFTVDAKDAWKIVDLVKPTVVIPMHFRTDRTTLPLAPVEKFTDGAGDTPVEWVEGSSVEIGAGMLVEGGRRVIVLEPAN